MVEKERYLYLTARYPFSPIYIQQFVNMETVGILQIYRIPEEIEPWNNFETTGRQMQTTQSRSSHCTSKCL